MVIDEVGALTAFEPMPSEVVHYFAVVNYGTMWEGGPCGTDRGRVIEALQTTWKDCKAARIYTIKLPMDALPASPRSPVSVEEDGDEVFTPLSFGCQQWKCIRDNGGMSVKLNLLANGYWTCPKCRGSYGKGQLVDIEAKEAP